jgi:hypothetical protein
MFLWYIKPNKGVNKMKKYNVKIYFSGYVPREVEASNEERAILTARELINEKQKIDSLYDMIEELEPWGDADTAEEIEDNV